MSKWTRFRDRILGRFFDWLKDITGWEEPAARPEDLEPAKPPAPPPPAVSELDEVPFRDLKWKRGGEDLAWANAVVGVAIADLRVDGRGLSYRWAQGGCELLGASSRSDASCLACFFVRKSGGWFGGKIDWISTSRQSRSFSNIHGGYKGWSSADLGGAEAYAFVIVSPDGRRTNTIVQEA